MKTLKTMFRPIITGAVAIAASLCTASAQESPERFININLHLLGGASYVTNNYVTCFPEVSDINSSMGPAFGAGAEVTCRVGRRFALGTGLNFVRNSRRMDMAVAGGGKPSVSNVFQRNIYYALEFPIFLRWEVKIAPSVRWNIDGGLYYAYGTGGKQKNIIYDAKVNDLGQLMMTRTQLDAGYYADDNAFVNSYRRGDLGLHIATGLTFRSHLTVGVRSHIGFKDVARSTGLVNPSAHNIDLMALVGWTF